MIAEVYYPTEGYDENSFQVIATTVDTEGNEKIYVVDAGDILEDRFDVPMEEWGKNLGKKIAAGYKDKVSLSRFIINVDKMNIVGAYFTVIKKGETTSDTYAGTFAGSGVGSYYDIRERKVLYSK